MRAIQSSPFFFKHLLVNIGHFHISRKESESGSPWSCKESSSLHSLISSFSRTMRCRTPSVKFWDQELRGYTEKLKPLATANLLEMIPHRDIHECWSFLEMWACPTPFQCSRWGSRNSQFGVILGSFANHLLGKIWDAQNSQSEMIHDWLVSLLPGRPSNMNNLSCVILEEKSCNDLSFSRSLIIDAFRLVWAKPGNYCEACDIFASQREWYLK